MKKKVIVIYYNNDNQVANLEDAIDAVIPFSLEFTTHDTFEEAKLHAEIIEQSLSEIRGK